MCASIETEEQAEFKFAELDDRAKERARDNWRQHQLDYDWWDDVYGEAVTIGALMGIEIGENVSRTVKGKHVSSPDISFSGFWSQGDGCCFSGQLNVPLLKGAVDRVKTHAPQDEELHAFATRAEAIHASIVVHLMALRMKGDLEDEDEILLDRRLQIKGEERSYSTGINDGDCPEEFERDMDRLVSDFADWIYDQLEAEHDHLTSNETIDADIEAAEILFDEFGSSI